MSFNDRSFACAQLCYLVVILVASIIWPGENVWVTIGWLAGTWIIVSLSYQFTRTHNSAGWWTLLAATTVLAVGVIINVHYFTVASGGSIERPVLTNPDAGPYFDSALSIIDPGQGEPLPPHRQGYPRFVASIWKISGISIFTPIVVNMAMILLSVILSGVTASRLLRGRVNKSPQWIATCAMIMTASVCYYLNSGTLLLKEASLSLGIALCAVAISGLAVPFASRRNSALAACGFIAGLLLVAIARFQYIYVAGLGILLLMAWQRKKAVMPIGMLVACGAVWILVEEFVLTGTLGTTRMMTNAVWTADANLPYYFDNNLSHRAYDSMIGNYFSYPIWQKALLLPVSMATQFLTPFPWNFARDTIYGPTLAYAHLAYPWYALGGLTIYFFGFCLRKADKAVLKWATWGLVAWSIPAFLYAGTISRYSLCFVPLLVPIAVYVVAECARLKSFKRWSAAYCVLLTVALISCHYIQSNAL